jgi:hypothetical protein
MEAIGGTKIETHPHAVRLGAQIRAIGVYTRPLSALLRHHS